MSTTSTVITIIICIVLVAAIGYALVKGIWTAAMKITVPIQIALFIVMLVCVVRLFCTKENAQKLYRGIEQTGISQNVENTMRSALNLKPSEISKSEEKPVQAAAVSVGSEQVVTPAPAAAPVADRVSSPVPKAETARVPPAGESGSKTEDAPVAADVQVKAAPAQQPVVKSEPVPVPAPDYSHLDKGRKTFTYALPFNAKVTVGFKSNTYRVISESMGSLDASEKKEIGKLILTALGEYVGKTIDNCDKAKISIESRYDEADDHTRVFAIIPPDAIED